MDVPSTLPPEVRALLRCPSCRSLLDEAPDTFTCTSSSCGGRFPIVNGVPVLIDERECVFSLDDYVRTDERVARAPADGGLLRRVKRAVDRAMPDVTLNLSAQANYETFAKLKLLHLRLT